MWEERGPGMSLGVSEEEDEGGKFDREWRCGGNEMRVGERDGSGDRGWR